MYVYVYISFLINHFKIFLHDLYFKDIIVSYLKKKTCHFLPFAYKINKT